MALDVAHYHGWHGARQSPWRGCLALVWVSLRQVFRRKAYWVVLALGALQFLLIWSLIYIITQLQPPEPLQRAIYERIGFSANPARGQENGYVNFMDRQNVVVMLLLAFSGSLLVGNDFRENTLAFYLARRIDRVHYIVGKLLAVSAIVSLLTVVPALILFIEYGMFTSSTEYWTEHWSVPLSILGYGAVLCAVTSIVLVSLSAWLQRLAPIVVAWSTLFLLLGRLANFLRDTTRNRYWELLDPWRQMRLVGRFCFDRFTSDQERNLAYWSLGILCGVCVVALVFLTRRVRAVEVVT